MDQEQPEQNLTTYGSDVSFICRNCQTLNDSSSEACHECGATNCSVCETSEISLVKFDWSSLLGDDINRGSGMGGATMPGAGY